MVIPFEIKQMYFGKQSKVPKLRAFSIATFLEDFAAHQGSCSGHPPAPISIALSISEKWLISHEDESDDRTAVLRCTGTSPLRNGRKVGFHEG